MDEESKNEISIRQGAIAAKIGALAGGGPDGRPGTASHSSSLKGGEGLNTSSEH